MAFINDEHLQELKNQLVSDPSLLGKHYRARKSEYYLKSVDHSLVEDMVKQGWEEYTSPLKTKTKLRMPKSHDRVFEDQVWCQLYELGFRTLNADENFRLPYGKGGSDKKQIDVIAIDDETAIIVECKSSKAPKKAPSYKDEFLGLSIALDGFKKSLHQLTGKTIKVKYIFATKNLRMDVDGEDARRLKDNNAFLFNDNTYDYVASLIKYYKSAARYQFMSLLFKGQLITKDRLEVAALEGTMGGKKYYMFSIEPHLLLRMGFVLHRTRANESEMPTYQRLLVPSRLKGISKFINDGGYFPNSIILNFNNLSRQKVQFEAGSRGKKGGSRMGMLKIPNAYAIAYIIDGQHRVYGYAASEYKTSNTIPVVAFVDLESTEQLEIFMDINQNQKAVSATLRLTLEEDLYWAAERADSRLKALRSSIIRELGGSINGPLYNKISLGEDKALLSASPFSSALSKIGFLPVARGNNYDQESLGCALYNINNHNHDKEMHRSRSSVVRFINYCYEFVEENYPDILLREQYFILSNRGTFAFLRTIGSLNKFVSEKHKLSPTCSVQSRFDAIEKYLVALLDYLSNIEDKEAKPILSQLGAGAENGWFMFFESLINKTFSDFETPDLVDWRERQDEDLQLKGRELGIQVEQFMKKTIIENLQLIFGEAWSLEIGAIQRDCEKRAKEEMEKAYKNGLGLEPIAWTEQFFISDYKTIIKKYWTKKPEEETMEYRSFSEIFSIDIGKGFNSKDEQVKWIDVFNSFRNLWAHEGSKERRVNKEEVGLLEQIHTKLNI